MTQNSRNVILAVTTASSRICDEIFRPSKRTQLIVVNTDATSNVTIAKGYADAVANRGIVLSPNNGTYQESSDSGFQCWQGPIFCVSGGSTNISVVEVVDDGE